MWLSRPLAVAKRDFLIWKSYRFASFLNIFVIYVQVLIMYYVSKTINVGSIRIKDYNEKYIPFFFIGIVLTGYFLSALQKFSLKIKREQIIGTFEAVISTPISNFSFISGLAIWDFLWGGIQVFVYFLLGAFFFNFQFGIVHFMSFALVLTLGMISFISFAIISASFSIYFKKTDPFNLLFAAAMSSLSGAYFPITLLPDYLQRMAKFIPLTYVLDASRLIFLKGYHVNLLKNQIVTLLAFCIILFPFSIAIFNLVIKQAMRDGTLSQY